MVTISFTPEEVAERAAEVRLPVGERIDEPDVLTAIRLAFVAPEPGDEPHSQLVKEIDSAGWDAGQAIEASAQLLRIGDGSAHAGFWRALSQEVAAAGGVDGPPPARG